MAEIMRVHSVLQYGSGSPGLTTFYFLPGTAGGVTADAVDAFGRVQDFWATIPSLLKTTFSAEVQAEVDVLEATTGELTGFLDGGTSVVIAGSSTAESLPIAAMLLLRSFTGDIHAGRRVRGRSFIGPVVETNNNSGVPTSSARTDLLLGAAQLLTGATATVPVVWSRPNSPVGDPGFHSEILSYQVADYFSVLRSRRDA